MADGADQRPRVMAVTFERHGQLHYLDAGGEQYEVGDQVLFPTPDGTEVATVVWAPEDSRVDTPLPLCAGPAGAADLRRDEAMRARRATSLETARALVADHELGMKVIAVDITGDRDPGTPEQTAIYFTAPERVDFRGLLRDLLKRLNTRIDLRQLGDREAASMSGGVGACGREVCCATWMTKIEAVGMRLAADQGLPANPLRIQGACGRLMCCLKYEHPLYVEFDQRAPKIGSTVEDGEVSGVVVSRSVPDQSVGVRDGDGQVHRCPVEASCGTAELRRGRVRSMAARQRRRRAGG